MGDVLMVSFRERQGQKSSERKDGGARHTIEIELLSTGELAYALNGAFTGSRRLTAQAMVKVLDRVMDD